MMIESPPRYAEAIEIYSAVLTKAPSGSAIATAAKKGLERADHQKGLDEFQRELEQEIAELELLKADRQAELDRRRSEGTPLMGRYDARGWLESRKMPNGGMAW